MLCILSVFIPTFILNEPVRSLFMPLTLAVGFSMIASYLLSSTLVPVLSVWLVRHKGEQRPKIACSRVVAGLQPPCGSRDPAFAGLPFRDTAACRLLFWLVGSGWATELFPQVDPASS